MLHHGSGITALLTVYKRPYTFRNQLDALLRQTARPDAIWAFVQEPENVNLDLDFAGVDRVVTCSPNSYFHMRFATLLAAPTELVAVLDDDVMPGSGWLANAASVVDEFDAIVGSAGVLVSSLAAYSHRWKRNGWQLRNDAPLEVDLVGQSWVLRREWLTHMFSAPPVTGTNAEDVELAARSWRRAGIRSFLAPHPASRRDVWGCYSYRTGVDAAASYRRPHYQAERLAVIRAEVAGGWKLLKDR